MARMNWDRVRKESQAKRSGSEWIGSDDLGLIFSAEPSPPSTKRGGSRRSEFAKMPGCACQKAVGFVGQHRKICPLRKGPGLNVHPKAASDRTQKEYPQSIKNQLSAVGDFLSSLQSQMHADRRFTESHRQNTERLIQVLQEELRNTSNAR